MVLEGLIVPAAFVLVFGSVIGFDRWREPRRPLHRPFAVADTRTFSYAQRRIERLVERGGPEDLQCAWMGATAICVWLRGEVRSGRPGRRIRRASQRERWEAQAADLKGRFTAG